MIFYTRYFFLLFIVYLIIPLGCTEQNNQAETSSATQSPKTTAADASKITVKAIKVNGGWGYEIYQGEKRLIHQPFLPAKEGNRTLSSKSQALKVGDFAASKIRQGLFPPTINIRELDSLTQKQ